MKSQSIILVEVKGLLVSEMIDGNEKLAYPRILNSSSIMIFA